MKYFFCLLLSLTLQLVFSQQFKWVKGASQNGTITGVYGTQAIPSNSNQPGNRHGSANWHDAQGRLWMFGGEGISSQPVLSWLNDLWRFDPQSQQWVWLQGSNAPDAPGIYGPQTIATASAMPGAREFMMSWIDLQGNFWMFGGDGFGNSNTFGRLNDLWRFNPQTLQWTWMKGLQSTDNFGIYGTQGIASSSVMPGSRYGSATWVDAQGNLWLYGGKGYAASGGDGNLSDLWMYNIQTNQWTWVKGSNQINQNAVYGSLGISSNSVMPGALHFPGYWVHNNELFLYGGSGLGAASQGYLGDLWKYNSLTNQWVWMKGSGLVNQPGNYGILGVSSPSVLPGGRYSAVCWKSNTSKVYLFGGYGFSSGPVGALNDFYVYDIVTNQFTWLKGSTGIYTNGTYGTLGQTAVTNMPGSRRYNTYWTLPNGACWLFGGLGSDAASPSPDNMQDLWTYAIPCNPDSITVSPNVTACPNTTFVLTAHAYYPGSVSWYASAQGTTAIGNGSVLSLAYPASGSYSVFASQNSCTLNPRTAVTLSVHALPSVTVMGSSSLCAGQNLWLQATPLNSVIVNTYSWSTSQWGPVINFTPLATGAIQVTVSSAQNCTQTAAIQITVVPLPTLALTAPTLLCSGQTLVFNASGATSYSWNMQPGTSTWSVVPTGSVLQLTLSGVSSQNCSSNLVQTFSLAPTPTLNVQILNALGLNALCAGVTHTLTASGASQYTWNGSVLASSLITTPAAGSVISLQAQYASGVCTAHWTVEAVPCISGIENVLLSTVRIFPNPTSRFLYVQNANEVHKIDIRDVSGRLCYTILKSFSQPLILPELAQGLYYLELYAQDILEPKVLKLWIKPD